MGGFTSYNMIQIVSLPLPSLIPVLSPPPPPKPPQTKPKLILSCRPLHTLRLPPPSNPLPALPHPSLPVIPHSTPTSFLFNQGGRVHIHTLPPPLLPPPHHPHRRSRAPNPRPQLSPPSPPIPAVTLAQYAPAATSFEREGLPSGWVGERWRQWWRE